MPFTRWQKGAMTAGKGGVGGGRDSSDSYAEMQRDDEEEDDDNEEEQDEAEEVGSDEESSDRVCTWRIAPSESAYDDGMLRILQLSKPTKSPFKFGCNILSLVMLLGFNAALQLVVVSRVWELVDVAKSEKENLVFAPSGNCYEEPASAYTRVHMHAVTQPRNWDCGSLWPMALSNTSWLDTNNDSYWSAVDDNITAVGQNTNAFFKKSGNLTNIFRSFMEDAKRGLLRYQTTRNFKESSSKAATQDFTKIPMEWMQEEEPVISLCNNVDPHLCGNLELRGILSKHIPDSKLTADERIQECRDIYDRCLRKFGELFRSYTKFAEQTCGEMQTYWVPEQMVIVNRYENADKYDPFVNKQAITTLTYSTFLLLVLIIWWLIVIGELRQVLSWWAVLINIQSESTDVRGQDDASEDLSILGISVKHKWLIGLMVLLPRTLIILLLSYIGTDFLIYADSYADLILNSVALGFLIEVDEMLFAAVTSTRTKDNLERMQTVVATHHAPFDWCVTVGHFPTSIPLIVFVVAMALAQMSKAYILPHGKIDLSGAYMCLCHLEGPECVAAQILGGETRVPKNIL